MGFFGKIIGALKKTRDNISAKLSALFSRGIGDDFYDELEEILISADISVATAEEIVEQIREEARREKLKDKEYVVDLLKDVIEDILNEAEVPKIEYPAVFMLVGVNGVGKTTTIGKLANYFVREKKSVTLAAADTFRAAAADQLTVWADRAKVRIVKHEEGSDPSAVVFDAVSSAKAKTPTWSSWTRPAACTSRPTSWRNCRRWTASSRASIRRRTSTSCSFWTRPPVRTPSRRRASSTRRWIWTASS